MPRPARFVLLMVLSGASSVSVIAAAGCGGSSTPNQPTPVATATATPTPTPTPTPTSTPGLAYVPDVKAILDADCLRCHSTSNATGGISVSTYAEVMRMVRAGDASSTLIRTTQVSPRGSMNRYLTGDVAGKADAIRRWVVDYGAAQTR